MIWFVIGFAFGLSTMFIWRSELHYKLAALWQALTIYEENASACLTVSNREEVARLTRRARTIRK